MTKLGRLVKAGLIKNLEDIFTHSLPIKEAPIIDYFLKDLKDEVMKIMVRVCRRQGVSMLQGSRQSCDCRSSKGTASRT